MFLVDGFFSFVGNLTFWPVFFLIVGTVMFAIELYVPGFGFFGISGIVCYVIAIIMTARTVEEFFAMLVILLAVLAVLTTVVLVLFSKGKVPRSIVLQDSISEKATGVQAENDITLFVGMRGKAVSALRPSGICDINGVRLDVITEGEYIEINTPVIVTKVEEGRLIVKQE